MLKGCIAIGNTLVNANYVLLAYHKVGFNLYTKNEVVLNNRVKNFILLFLYTYSTLIVITGGLILVSKKFDLKYLFKFMNFSKTDGVKKVIEHWCVHIRVSAWTLFPLFILSPISNAKICVNKNIIF